MAAIYSLDFLQDLGKGDSNLTYVNPVPLPTSQESLGMEYQRQSGTSPESQLSKNSSYFCNLPLQPYAPKPQCGHLSKLTSHEAMKTLDELTVETVTLVGELNPRTFWKRMRPKLDEQFKEESREVWIPKEAQF